MEFKAMSEAMCDKEVTLVLHLIYPFGRVEKIICDYNSNSIDVLYSLLEEEKRIIHPINFLPDDIYLLTDSVPQREVRMEESSKLYQYHQFMVAKGYSEIWLNNPYVEL